MTDNSRVGFTRQQETASDGAGPPARGSWPDLDLRPSRELVRVPDGTYDAKAIRADAKLSVAGQRRIFIWFEIIGGSSDGVRLFMACPIPPNRRPSPSSKFYSAWTIANGGAPPRRTDQMSLRVFENRLFRVRVTTVTKNYQQRPLPPALRYSVIAEILP